jgi:hypothetical protein
VRTRACSTCGAEIAFVQTRDGAWSPIDPKPNPDGNVIVRLRQNAPPLGIFGVPADAHPDEQRWMSHWATCGDPGPHRRTADPVELEQ